MNNFSCILHIMRKIIKLTQFIKAENFFFHRKNKITKHNFTAKKHGKWRN